MVFAVIFFSFVHSSQYEYLLDVADLTYTGTYQVQDVYSWPNKLLSKLQNPLIGVFLI